MEPNLITINTQTLTRPKRTLSAYNLFYRFKRQTVLKAVARGVVDKEEITRLIKAAPGTEYEPEATIES